MVAADLLSSLSAMRTRKQKGVKGLGILKT